MIQFDEKTEMAYRAVQRIKAAKRQGRAFEQEFPRDAERSQDAKQIAAGLYAPIREVWNLIKVNPR